MQNMQNAPGKGFLKVVGILMIIGGGIGFLANLVSFSTSGNARLLITLLLAAYELFLGIMGVINADKLEKARLMFALAIPFFALPVISVIINYTALSSIPAFSDILPGYMADSIASFIRVGLVIGAVLGFTYPILYLVGAVKNRNAARRLADHSGMNDI